MRTLASLLLLLFLLPFAMNPARSQAPGQRQVSGTRGNDTAKQSPRPTVTFIELGSVKCIPCKAMQPVMASIEKKYPRQVKVIFYDVWKSEQQKYADQYGVRVIPTQVFLDKDGREFFRHEGFYPEKDIDTLLQRNGVRPQGGG